MIIDGKKLSNNIYKELKKRIKKIKEKGKDIHLAILYVGNDPSSRSYIAQKEKKAQALGIQTTVYRFKKSVSEEKLIQLINTLNNSPFVDAVIIQQPLPKHIHKESIINTVCVQKDIDGFRSDSKYDSPISLAVNYILEHIFISKNKLNNKDHHKLIKFLSKKTIAIIGKGDTGGKPVIDYFRKMGLRINIIDTKTHNKKELLRNADIIISAVGKKSIIISDNIKKGVILIGIGLHKEKDGKFYGDYNENDIKDLAYFYTPTPGGVGPINVAMLLQNLVDSVQKNIVVQKNIDNK